MPRKKQPINLLMAKGNRSHMTKKEIEARKKQEIKAKADKIEPPSYLPDELKENFNKIAYELMDVDIMSNLDCEALARFVFAEHEYEKVSLKLFKLKTVGTRYYDLLQIQDKWFKQCRQSASDLGLTISSRCKLVVPHEKDKGKPTKAEREFGDV